MIVDANEGIQMMISNWMCTVLKIYCWSIYFVCAWWTNRASFHFWREELGIPEPEFDLYFWRWCCFGRGRMEMRTVTHFSCALNYPKGKYLGIILLFQWSMFRILQRKIQSHELRPMDGLLQEGWITGLRLLKYVLWYILSARFFSWHHFRKLPTLGNFSSGGRGPVGHTRIRGKHHVFSAVFSGIHLSYLSTPMGGVNLHLGL